MNHPRWWKLLLSLLAFIVALYSKEFALIVPLLLPVFIVLRSFLSSDTSSNYSRAKILATWLVFPAIEGLVLLHRFLNINSFVGVYGSDVHLNMDPEILLANLGGYIIRVCTVPLDARYGPFLSRPHLISFGILVLGIFLAGVGLVFLTAGSPKPSSAGGGKNKQLAAFALLILVTVLSQWAVLRTGFYLEGRGEYPYPWVAGHMALLMAVVVLWWKRLTDGSGQELLVIGVIIWGCFGLSLIPVLNLGISSFDTQGERFLYFPSAFFCLGAAVFLAYLIRNLAVWVVIVACLAGLFTSQLI